MEIIKEVIKKIELMKTEKEKIEFINELKIELHKVSPFKDEPVDCVIWVEGEEVFANDYNPNSVATPEMELLKISIENDGFTQPIVTYKEEQEETKENKIVVIDGFHRNRVGKEYQTVKERLKGYLPITIIRDSQTDRSNRIASTIRHNRARGKHKIESMSEIVLELKRRNWSPKKIGKQLGMDPDEVLRLTQISGLVDMFDDKEFTESWEAIHFTEIEDEIEEIEETKIKSEGKTPEENIPLLK